jgi:integrase
MKIKTIKRDGINERAYIVVDDNGYPIDRICWFTANELSKWANNTQKNQTRNVVHIEKWAATMRLNLDDEFSSSCFTGGQKFRSLIKHLERFSPDTGEVTSIAPRLVSPKYFNDRIDTCISYFDYLVQVAIEKRRAGDPLVKELEDKFSKLKNKLIKEKRPKDDVSLNRGLSDNDLEAILHAFNDPQIFGWNAYTSLRNELIVRLFLSTGIRKSDLLSLKINDCITTRLPNGAVQHIVIKQNVVTEDPRKNVPHLKTLSRVIPISKDLANVIEQYKKVRPQTDEVKKQSPFLFLSSRSPYRPLSSDSINSIFTSIRARLPELEKLGSHRLRHSFFENLEKTLHKNGYDDALKTKIANTLGGWSGKSNTRLKYQKRATAEQCEQAITAMHNQLESNFNDIPF